jgi:hypothetical protein
MAKRKQRTTEPAKREAERPLDEEEPEEPQEKEEPEESQEEEQEEEKEEEEEEEAANAEADKGEKTAAAVDDEEPAEGAGNTKKRLAIGGGGKAAGKGTGVTKDGKTTGKEAKREAGTKKEGKGADGVARLPTEEDSRMEELEEAATAALQEALAGMGPKLDLKVFDNGPVPFEAFKCGGKHAYWRQVRQLELAGAVKLEVGDDGTVMAHRVPDSEGSEADEKGDRTGKREDTPLEAERKQILRMNSTEARFERELETSFKFEGPQKKFLHPLARIGFNRIWVTNNPSAVLVGRKSCT